MIRPIPISLRTEWLQNNTLHENLENRGYNRLVGLVGYMDRLAEKYSFIRKFHKVKTYVDARYLSKNSLTVFFDNWHVDIIVDGEIIKTFGEDTLSEEINEFILPLELKIDREIKLKRILKDEH